MNTPSLMVQFRKYGLGLIIVWTCIIAAILSFIINEFHKDTIKDATKEARDYYTLNLHYRRWSARIGGVYAPIDKVAPNPYLTLPDRDVKTVSGKSFTLVNPAYMTRMVFEAIQKDSRHPIISRLVSLKPLNPANAPSTWEMDTLKLFGKIKVGERSQVVTIDERPYLQYMAAFITEESCLKCHAHQGYKVGDVRGGMSIAIPMSGYLVIEAERINPITGGFALLWILGTAGIAVSSNRRHQQEMKIIAERTTAVDLSERYSIVADGIPSLIAHVDRDERYIYVNRAYADWVELPREQIIGNTVKETIGEANYELSRPYIRQVLEGRSGKFEKQMVSHGRELTHLIDFVPQIDCRGETVAYFSLINDITELKHSVEALRQNEERYRTILQTAMDGFWLIDTKGRLLDVNETYCQMSGYSAQELLDMHVPALMVDETADDVTAHIQQIMIQGEHRFESRHRRKDGSILDIEVSVQYRPIEGGRIVAFLRDISKRKQAEQELQKKNAEIEQFIYTVSHDLRSPLVTVKTFMGYLEKNLAEGNQKQLAQDIQFIHSAADKMKLLLDELLEMSRIGRVESPPVRVSFKEVAAEVLDALAGVINERKVDIRLPDTDLMLYGDRPRLCQILQNLIENAIKYSREGSIPRIELCVRQAGGEPVFCVKDDGIGIDPQYHNKIFGIFEKLNPKSHGAGLGLSMVQRIVENCGGRVWVESEGAGKGCCFNFTLPQVVVQS